MSLIQRKNIQYDKNHHWFCMKMLITLYHIIYPVINKAHSQVSSTIWWFILNYSFYFFTFKSIYLKYLKYIKSRPKFGPIISNNMWPNVFRSEVGLYVPCCSVTYFYYILFLIVCKRFPLTLKTFRCWNILSSYSRVNRINSS